MIFEKKERSLLLILVVLIIEPEGGLRHKSGVNYYSARDSQ